MDIFSIFFGVISITFFFLSLKTDKKFMETKDISLYPSVKNKGRAAKVFFIVTCFRLGLTLSNLFLFMTVANVAESTEGNGSMAFQTVFPLFTVGGFFTLTTFIIGLSAVVNHKKAEKLYTELSSSNKTAGGFNSSGSYGAMPSQGFNGANYNNVNNGNANFNNANNNSGNNGSPNYNTGSQGGSRSNLYTNDPGQLRSSTNDQSPFEAPPPNYYNYNYGSFGGYQQGRPNAAPNNNRQSVQQKPVQQPVNTAANKPSPVNNSSNVNKPEPKQYVSQMPEVTPFSASKPSAAANVPASTPVSTPANAAPPQKPAVPVILPVVPEIKRESTVRCKHCGVTNKTEDKFCTFCGKSLSK